MDLRVLTFNIRFDTARDGQNAWPFRREMAAELVSSLDCHVIGFQEAMPNQRADLEATLAGYQWIGHGRDIDHSGEQCCMAIREGLEILDSGTFWLATTPGVAGAVGWDAQLTRICTWARLAKDGLPFTAFNAHWDHVGVQARVETARLLFDRVMSTDGPVLLMGDFNTTPDSEPITILRGALQDSYADLNPGSKRGTFHGFGQQMEGDRIDYLFASPEFLIVESRILDQAEGPFPSDHYPVFARLELLDQ